MQKFLRRSTQRDNIFRGKVLAVSHASILSANRMVYRSLIRWGIDLELVIPSRLVYAGREIEAEPDSADDPPIHRLATQWQNFRLLRYPSLRVFLDKIRPAIVIVEADTASLLAFEVGRWCRLSSAKLICRTNENQSWRPSASIARGGLRELPCSLMKCAFNIINVDNVSAVCTSSIEALRLFDKNGFRNSRNLPMGTDRVVFRYNSRIRRTVRKELGLQSSDLVVSYFGRLVPEKGVDTLIDALSRMREIDWWLFLNEFQPESAYLANIRQQLANGRIESRVQWIKAKHGEIARYMTASDVTVLPSRTTPKWFEQFGRVVPEAMAYSSRIVVRRRNS